MHIINLVVPEPSSFEVEISVERLEGYKSPGTDQIPAELIQAVGNTLRSVIHELTNSVRNKEELPQQRKESIIVPMCKESNKTDCCDYRRISVLPATY
jgi:hypothetical protein